MSILKLSCFFRSSHPEVFLRKGALKMPSKFTGEHPYQSVISIKMQSKFIEITLRHECSPVNLLHIFRKTVSKNIPGWLFLNITNNLVWFASDLIFWSQLLHSQKKDPINIIIRIREKETDHNVICRLPFLLSSINPVHLSKQNKILSLPLKNHFYWSC